MKDSLELTLSFLGILGMGIVFYEIEKVKRCEGLFNQAMVSERPTEGHQRFERARDSYNSSCGFRYGTYETRQQQNRTYDNRFPGR